MDPQDLHSRDGATLARRELLSAAALGAVALVPAAACAAQAGAAPPPRPALAGDHVIAPLPFKANALRGISEKLIVSHHENNYSGAVKNLNRVEKELANITKETPAFVVAALRERELMFRNSKTLHEHYFSNLGGDGKRAGAAADAVVASYSSAARFEEHFKSTGLGLAGGSGWVCLGFELESGELRIVASGNHTQSEAFAAPILVMDMYEHAYQMDYGAAAAKYIEAFFDNINWTECDARLARARRMCAARP